ncbi:MAG: hypothetical protein V4795_16975 [Pseudomonadota bacterium]
MQGDFSKLDFDPHASARGVDQPAQGVLHNIRGVLHQQGRVITDADLSESDLLALAWQGQAGRDTIGAGICAVPATEPQGFRVEAAFIDDGQVQLALRPGRAWADGLLTHLVGAAANPLALVQRSAAYFGPPLATPQPGETSITDGVRDAVILELSEEALHGLQAPQRLMEPALGGPDTAARAYVNFRLRLLRLAEGEDCHSIGARLRDDPAAKGRLTVSLAPVVALVGDCPVVGGGGYTGFEHQLYRIEIADVRPGDPARFKWSAWNGGLVGRGRFDATLNPARVLIDAGRPAIVNSGLSSFYLEALDYLPGVGAWQVVYATMATLNTAHELELAAPASFGSLPATTAPVFFRLWNGIADIADHLQVVNPTPLRDGIRLAFDAPAGGNYRPGDHWVFSLRAGEISNPQLLLDQAPPVGVVYHRVPLAEIHWTAAQDTRIAGLIEDCRRRFRPLTNQTVCCTFLVGDGVSSFGDFNALEEAAAHLPPAGGELCLLPGVHRANLVLDGRSHIKIHGCRWRSLLLPRNARGGQPILQFTDCSHIEVCELDLVSYDGMAVRITGRREDSCSHVQIHHNRVIARQHAMRADNAAQLQICHNRLHLLDTVDGGATLSLQADDVLVERNELLLLPFVDPTPDEPEVPDDDPERDPADPCARPQVLYLFPALVLRYALRVWAVLIADLLPRQPYRAIGGIHVRAGSERVRLLENQIAGGAGNGITLGGDLDVVAPRPDADDLTTAPAIHVTDNGQFLAVVQDEQGQPLADADLYLQAATQEQAVATDRSDARGMASIKAAPGRHVLAVSPPYRVLRISEARDEGVLVNAVTLARDGLASRAGQRGFLHEISIEANNIAQMGLSGIGFATHAGSDLKGRATSIPSGDAKAALLAWLDATLAGLAMTPLLRATDPVRDLVILNNRLHHNLQNPFTEAMRAEAAFIGRGGISLAVAEGVRISGNHIHDNGPRAVDPACGIFVGYGDNLEVSDNVLAANGVAAGDAQRRLDAGIGGGIFIRFAGAITSRLSTSSGHQPALRVHDNRVDQPAGRALSAFAFGPVSVANNHLNSEASGRFGFLDLAVGGVWLMNLGGIHRLLARLFGQLLDHVGHDRRLVAGKAYATLAEAALPGGETIFDANFVRLGIANRSFTAQTLLAMDDLGYSGNTASVYRGDPFFANALLLGDCVRASDSRLREDVSSTLSILSMALRLNMTANNQADHCIVALPRAGTQSLPTVDRPNQVLDASCSQRFDQPADTGNHLVGVLAANADALGGTLSAEAFTGDELASVAQQMTGQAVGHINTTQVATSQAYQVEAARLASKHGSSHPRAVAMKAQGDAGAQTNRLLQAGAEAVAVAPAQAPKEGASFSGRFVNDRGQGLGGHVVDLVRSNGSAVLTVGRSDERGAFAASFDAERTQMLQKEGTLFARVSDLAGKELLSDKTALQFSPGARLQATLVVPVRVVPKSVAGGGAVVYPRGAPTPPAPTPPAPTPPSPTPPSPTPPSPTPPSPTPPSPTPPAPTPPGPTPPAPTPPTKRTDLAELDLDPALHKRLLAAGIADVETLVGVDAQKLVEIVGDRSTAAKLVESAKALLARKGRLSAPVPAPAPVPKPAPTPTPTPTLKPRTGRDTGKKGG